MVCPFLRDVVDEEALVLRRAFRRERVFRNRLDPLAFPDDHLYERYRFSADGIRYLCRLLGPRIKHRTARSHALSVEQMVCVALRFFASGAFLYSVGDTEQLNKATICRTIRSVCLAIKALADVFISFPGHRRLCDIKEEFYRIAGFPNVIGAVDCTHIRIKAPSGAHEADFVNRKSFHSINVQTIKRKSTDISSYFKKKSTEGGVKEMAREQQRLSNSDEKEDGGEEQTEQHDKATKPVLGTEHNEEEKQTAAAQGQSAPLVTEVLQDTAKAGVRHVPGPTGEVTITWP
ncbi:putative nuclease HARBI1 [Triplophysa dalaica]|uniref:putative nuclease HARBI1 n=1 Tax=Triplophysa dalaica TaxID=1582913 RepID=UPI0024E03F9D|nr:putative nuclease HARBI1 [Triplophysa dalaica]